MLVLTHPFNVTASPILKNVGELILKGGRISDHDSLKKLNEYMKPIYSTLILPTPQSHRPHPLTRRNGLENQVEFLGLAHTFVTM